MVEPWLLSGDMTGEPWSSVACPLGNPSNGCVQLSIQVNTPVCLVYSCVS